MQKLKLLMVLSTNRISNHSQCLDRKLRIWFQNVLIIGRYTCKENSPITDIEVSKIIKNNGNSILLVNIKREQSYDDRLYKLIIFVSILNTLILFWQIIIAEFHFLDFNFTVRLTAGKQASWSVSLVLRFRQGIQCSPSIVEGV